MSRTIIQHIGPLNGMADEGSIFGQPNGSVSKQGYVPSEKANKTIWKINYHVGYNRNFNKLYTAISTANLKRTLSSYVIIDSGYFSSDVFTIQLIEDITSISTDPIYQKCEIYTDSDLKTLFYSFGFGEIENKTVETTAVSVGHFVNGVEVMPKNPPSFTTGTLYYLRVKMVDKNGIDLGYYSNVLEFIGQS